MRARYSPITPRASNWAPEKMVMMDARKAKPGTSLPWISQRSRTKARMPAPKIATAKPTTLARCNGMTEKPVIMFRACRASMRNV